MEDRFDERTKCVFYAPSIFGRNEQNVPILSKVYDSVGNEFSNCEYYTCCGIVPFQTHYGANYCFLKKINFLNTDKHSITDDANFGQKSYWES